MIYLKAYLVIGALFAFVATIRVFEDQFFEQDRTRTPKGYVLTVIAFGVVWPFSLVLVLRETIRCLANR